MSHTQDLIPRDRPAPLLAVAAETTAAIERPTVRVRTVDGSTVVDILNAETLFSADDISDLGDHLHRLVEAGHSQLLVNFQAVRSMSSDVLGLLAALHRRLEKSRGRLALTGVDPVLGDMLRICRLDRVFDIHGGESEFSRAIAAARQDMPGE